MWYVEVIIAVCIAGILGGGVYFTGMACDEYEVNCETMRLVSILKEVQEYNHHQIRNRTNDFTAECRIYKDKYIIYRMNLYDKQTYTLPHGVKIDPEANDFYRFKEQSLYGNVQPKTILVYKNKAKNKVIIDSVGRIRIKRVVPL